MRRISFLMTLICGLVSLVGWEARASIDLDRQYQLESIGVLKSYDNVDGLFSEYVAAVYNDYFSKQSRFVLNDISRAESLIDNSKMNYSKLIQDADILKQVAKSTRSESLIRTRITKEGSQYLFEIEWLHAPHLEILSTQSFTIEEPHEGTVLGRDLISEPLMKNLDILISHLPFIGHVTGRDDQSVTINIGSLSGIKPGDILVIGTLEDVKKHPLFKTIVDWRISTIGRVAVEQVEERMAFCKILEEEKGKQIIRFQKIIQIQNPQGSGPFKDSKLVVRDDEEEKSDDVPRLGWFGFGLFGGGLSRDFSAQTGSTSNTGGGFALGGKANGELWLTRQWFSQMEFRYATGQFSQSNSTTGVLTPTSQNGSVSSSFFSYLISFGYAYHLTDSLTGPKGWIKLGYKSNAYTLPISASEFTGPTTFSSIFVGVGGEMPIQEKWGVITNFNFRLLTSVKQSWLSTDATSSSDVELYVGGYHRLDQKMTIRVGLEIIANGADFGTTSNLSQKMVTFGPSLLYYF